MNKKKILLDFRKKLDEINYLVLYKEICGSVNFMFNPFQTEAAVVSAINDLPMELSSLMKFFVLGKAIERDIIVEFMGLQLVDNLVMLGLIEKDNGLLQLRNYVIVAYKDFYLVVNKPPFFFGGTSRSEDVYIGPDSYMLANFLPHRHFDKCLELCSGSGVISILNAQNSNSCDAVELNSHACEVSSWNCIINFADDKVHLHHGDLYNPIQSECYDLIVANPPFIPFPTDLTFYPMCGAGGELGLDIINNIIYGLDQHLKDNGMFLMIGEGVKNGDNIPMAALIEEALNVGYEIDLYIHSVENLRTHVVKMANFCRATWDNETPKNIEELLLNMHNMHDMTEYFQFTLIAKKIYKNKRTHFSKIKLQRERSIEGLYKSNLDKCEIRKLPNYYALYQGDDLIASVDEDAIDLLQKKDLDIIEYACKICDERNYDDKERSEFLEKIEKTSKDLIKANLLKKIDSNKYSTLTKPKYIKEVEI